MSDKTDMGGLAIPDGWRLGREVVSGEDCIVLTNTKDGGGALFFESEKQARLACAYDFLDAMLAERAKRGGGENE